MAPKAVLIVLACFLLINTEVSSEWEQVLTTKVTVAPAKTPELYKTSPPPPPQATKTPPPPPPATKTPPPTPSPPSTPPPSPPKSTTPYPPPATKTPPPVPSPPPVKAPVPPPSPPKTYAPPPVKAPAAPPPLQPPRNRGECTPLCVVRCKNHSRKNICMRACLACCERCKCVPPGQYGNREKCGKCYANMTTRGGKLKCP